MYNPYKQRGEWLDCNICGSSHRKILDADLTEYNSPVLTDIEREQCYTCTPIILDYSKFCKNCNTDNYQYKTQSYEKYKCNSDWARESKNRNSYNNGYCNILSMEELQ